MKLAAQRSLSTAKPGSRPHVSSSPRGGSHAVGGDRADSGGGPVTAPHYSCRSRSASACLPGADPRAPVAQDQEELGHGLNFSAAAAPSTVPRGLLGGSSPPFVRSWAQVSQLWQSQVGHEPASLVRCLRRQGRM